MKMPRPPRRIIIVWLLLLALLAGNTALAFMGLGAFSPVVHVVIAVVMAVIVLGIFMELDRGVSLFLVFAGAGFFWLALLLGLTAADYLTRFSFAPT